MVQRPQKALDESVIGEEAWRSLILKRIGAYCNGLSLKLARLAILPPSWFGRPGSSASEISCFDPRSSQGALFFFFISSSLLKTCYSRLAGRQYT